MCETYWSPLYAYIRRRGFQVDEAQDLTQEFFAKMLEKQTLEHVSREKGRFRAFLLASLKNFLSNYRRDERALKRRRVLLFAGPVLNAVCWLFVGFVAIISGASAEAHEQFMRLPLGLSIF